MAFMPSGEIDDPGYLPRPRASTSRVPSKGETVDLPENLYGAAMMAVVRSSQGQYPMFHGVTICIYAAMLLNMTLQIYMLHFSRMYISRPAINHARSLYRDFHHEAFNKIDEGVWEFSVEKWRHFRATQLHELFEICELPLSQPPFTLAVLFIWTMSCWVDVFSVAHWIEVWFRLPRSDDGCTHVVIDDHMLVATKTSRPVKAVIAIMVLLPKVVTAIFLWVIGIRWLMSTPSFEALLLNSVGLAFLTNLGTLLYAVFVPDCLQDMVRTYKLFEDREDWIVSERHVRASCAKCGLFRSHCKNPRCQRKFLRYAGRMLFVLVLIIAAPTVYLTKVQHVLRHYRWDVAGPCSELINRMARTEDW